MGNVSQSFKCTIHNPQGRILHEKLIVSQLFLNGAGRFIVAFTRAHHQNLHFTLSPIFFRSLLTLCFALCLGLPSRFVPSDFPIKFIYEFIIFPANSKYPTHSFLLDLCILVRGGRGYKIQHINFSNDNLRKEFVITQYSQSSA